MIQLKQLSKLWRTLEIPLINCETNSILTWSANCFIVSFKTTTFNWNKQQSKVTTQRKNQYLDYLIDPSFQK